MISKLWWPPRISIIAIDELILTIKNFCGLGIENHFCGHTFCGHTFWWHNLITLTQYDYFLWIRRPHEIHKENTLLIW